MASVDRELRNGHGLFVALRFVYLVLFGIWWMLARKVPILCICWISKTGYQEFNCFPKCSTPFLVQSHQGAFSYSSCWDKFGASHGSMFTKKFSLILFESRSSVRDQSGGVRSLIKNLCMKNSVYLRCWGAYARWFTAAFALRFPLVVSLATVKTDQSISFRSY